MKNAYSFLATELVKTVFQLKRENQLPISGFFMQGSSLDVILEKCWTEGKKCIIKTYFLWESRESLIALNFLNANNWKIGSGK